MLVTFVQYFLIIIFSYYIYKNQQLSFCVTVGEISVSRLKSAFYNINMKGYSCDTLLASRTSQRDIGAKSLFTCTFHRTRRRFTPFSLSLHMFLSLLCCLFFIFRVSTLGECITRAVRVPFVKSAMIAKQLYVTLTLRQIQRAFLTVWRTSPHTLRKKLGEICVPSSSDLSNLRQIIRA